MADIISNAIGSFLRAIELFFDRPMPSSAEKLSFSANTTSSIASVMRSCKRPLVSER